MNWSDHSNQSVVYPGFLLSDEDPVPEYKNVTIGFTAAYSVMFLVAVTGNSFVVHVARKQKPSRGSFNILVINLAMWDISYAFFVVSNQLHYLYFGLLWFQGGFATFLCKFVSFGILLSIFASILSLTVMAVDRYMAIVHVMKTPLTRKQVFLAVTIIAGVSCLFASIEWHKMEVVTVDYEEISITECYGLWSNDNELNLTLQNGEIIANFIIFYIIPLVTMTIMYIAIIRSLWLRSVPGIQIDENERKRKRQCKKVVMMLVTMVTVFAVGWLPVHAIHIADAYFPQCTYQLPYLAWTFMYFTAHANCAINPCFYLAFNEEYRVQFRKLGRRFLMGCTCSKANFRARRNELLLCRRYKHPEIQNIEESNQQGFEEKSDYEAQQVCSTEL